MKTLYLECAMGAAGDMLTAALASLLSDREQDAFVREFNALKLPHVTLSLVPSVKCGLAGLHSDVVIDGEREESHDVHDHGHEHPHDREHGHDHHAHHSHAHTTLGDIDRLIDSLCVSDRVKADARGVYRLIAEAESQAHGEPAALVHFHEVGAMDAVADVVAVSMLMEKLAPDVILGSPVHVGSGQVRCAHGVVPVPAPATAAILKDVPFYGGTIRGELCTPTGAALLKHFCASFGPMPVMKNARVGLGMGQKDFEAANCVRAFFGESDAAGESVLELCCNIDDMTGEELSHAVQSLMDAGALDCWTQPITMKKGRPAVMFCVLCRENEREAMLRAIFRNTTTLGVREILRPRYALRRQTRTVSTLYGKARIKCAEGFGVRREKIEYDDLCRIARAANVTLAEARKIVEKADRN